MRYRLLFSKEYGIGYNAETIYADDDTQAAKMVAGLMGADREELKSMDENKIPKFLSDCFFSGKHEKFQILVVANMDTKDILANITETPMYVKGESVVGEW